MKICSEDEFVFLFGRVLVPREQRVLGEEGESTAHCLLRLGKHGSNLIGFGLDSVCKPSAAGWEPLRKAEIYALCRVWH